MNKKKELNSELMDQMSERLRILGHRHRLRILELLDINGEMSVTEIVEAIMLPQGTVSQHLNTMRRGGIIASRRDATRVWYKVADEKALTILNCLRARSEKK